MGALGRAELVIVPVTTSQRARRCTTFVRECNRGTQTWFVPDETELAVRLPVG